MGDRDIEVPEYFICPISLQIMRDPVTVATGITYERECIERWLLKSDSAMCPVTKQLLPRDSELTPNHTLRRLIQAWCVTNAKNGVDRIPTPKSPLDRSRILKLVRDLEANHQAIGPMEKLEELAKESERNRRCMAEIGVGRAMVGFIIRCEKQRRSTCLGEALRILHLIWNPTVEVENLVKENDDFFESLAWVLGYPKDDQYHVEAKTLALVLMKRITKIARLSLLERLKLEYFRSIVKLLRDKRISQQGIKSALQTLIEACPWGRNRLKIVEAGAVFELVELELGKPENRRVTELVFDLLAQLCSCADGRERLLRHAGGIAMLAKRTLRVSPAVDERTVQILALVSKFSATSEVLMEMLRVGAVAKLCMVLQADCDAGLKSRARAALRLHSTVWNNSPCIAVYLMTRHPAR